jgi:hypothetical protein
MTMPEHDEDRLYAGAFAPWRELEPTDAQVAGVLQRVATDATRLRRARRWRPAVSWSATAIVLAATAAVVIGVAAVALVGHRGRGESEPANRIGASELVSRLAVLRRPQTAADRSLPQHLHLASGEGLGAIVPGLTRLVATLPNARIFMVVNEPAPPTHGRLAPLWSPRFGDLVSLIALTPSGNIETTGRPAVDLTNGLTPAKISISHRFRSGYVIGIVPDGVIRVRWGAQDRPHGAVHESSPRVTDNIVVARSVAVGGIVTSVKWYGPGGHRVPTSGRALLGAIAAQQAPMRAAVIRQDRRSATRPAAALLQHLPIFGSTTETRRGVSANGIRVFRPTLSSLPFGVLELTEAGEVPFLDPEQMREVITHSGARFWIVPGAHTVNDAQISRSLSPYGGGAGSGGIAPFAQIVAHGFTVGEPVGAQRYVRIRVVAGDEQTITVRTAHGRTRTVPVVGGVAIIPAGFTS